MRHHHLRRALCALAFLAAGAAHADGALDADFRAIRSWNLGDDAGAPQRVIDAIMAAHGDDAARADLAARLAGLLAPDATFEAKKFACTHLYIIGTAAQVPALAALLPDPASAHLARYALERIPGPEATRALLDALPGSPSSVAVGIVNSLGERADSEAMPVLTALIAHGDDGLALAAIAAVGKLGGGGAVDALRAAWPGAAAARRAALADALLACADAMPDADAATTIYRWLRTESGEPRIQAAALRGLMASNEAGRLALLAETIRNGGARARSEAMAHVRTLPDAKTTRVLVALFDEVDPATEALLIRALADRGDQAAAPALERALDSEDAEVRLAAIEALGAVGSARAVETLAAAAASPDRPTQQAARRSLERLQGDDVDWTLQSRLRRAAPPVQAEILRALAARGAVEAMPSLLRQTSSRDAVVRQEAYRALAMLAGAGEVPNLIRNVERAKSDTDRDQATRALVAAARRTPPGAEAAAPLIAKIESGVAEPVGQALIGALAGIGDASSLPLLRNLAADGAPAARAAAVRALAAWPTPETMEDLRRIAREAGDAGDRAAALDGYIRQLRADNALEAGEKVDRYVEALRDADGAAAKRRILAGLGDISDTRALDALDAFAGDPELGADARAAAEKVRRVFYTATASHKPDLAPLAFDNNIDTRWTSNAWQKPGMWFELDLSREADIRGIVLDASRSPEDFPRAYAVHVYADPGAPGDAVAAGEGVDPVIEITFEPVRGRYVRIVQTGESESRWWSIHEIRVLPK